MTATPQPGPPGSGRVHRFHLSGELDAASGPKAFYEIVNAQPQTGDTVELDLGDVTFIDSSGVALLIRAKAYLEGGECQLVLTNLSAPAHRLLEMLGLNDAFRSSPLPQ